LAYTRWITAIGHVFHYATSDGFLYLLSLPGDVYRFDGVHFVPSRVPLGFSGKVFGDNAGGLWVVADELVHLKHGIVVSHLKLKGIHGFQSVSSDADGTLWVGLRESDTPLCRVTDQGSTCFGKDKGISIATIDAILPDGRDGLWLGGPNGVVHWRRGGASEMYPLNASITSLARGADGSLWVGSEEGPGLGLLQLKDGALKPFVTPAFDGTTVSVTSLMVDRDGDLWVATDAKGIFRIHGNSVEHYGRMDGLSGDSAWDLLEDREGLVWIGTTSGIDSFREARVLLLGPWRD
jgi:ligand-binding sensor domain-containing protein